MSWIAKTYIPTVIKYSLAGTCTAHFTYTHIHTHTQSCPRIRQYSHKLHWVVQGVATGRAVTGQLPCISCIQSQEGLAVVAVVRHAFKTISWYVHQNKMSRKLSCVRAVSWACFFFFFFFFSFSLSHGAKIWSCCKRVKNQPPIIVWTKFINLESCYIPRFSHKAFFSIREKKKYICVFAIYGNGSNLVQWVEPFKQIINTLLTEGPKWNLMKIARAV